MKERAAKLQPSGPVGGVRKSRRETSFHLKGTNLGGGGKWGGRDRKP